MPEISILPSGERFAGMEYCVDKAFTERDEILNAARLAIDENPDNLPRRLGVSTYLIGETDPESAALVTGKKWKPGRTLKIFLNGGTEKIKDRIRNYVDEWSAIVNIKFKFVSDRNAEIRVNFDVNGSWSYLGTDALAIPISKPTMNYGWLTDKTSETEFSRVILHEFGHALGAIHEHAHPDAGIPWDRPAVLAYYLRENGWDEKTVDAQIFKKYARDQLNAGIYDPKSIMHYAVPKELLEDATKAVGWNTRLSQQDKTFMASEYPASSMTEETRGQDRVAAVRRETRLKVFCSCPVCGSENRLNLEIT